MSQGSQGSKPKWKVGSFLQQAVAGVESRLDLILAEEEDQKQLQAKNATAKSKPNEQTSSMETLDRFGWLYYVRLLTVTRYITQFVECAKE